MCLGFSESSFFNALIETYWNSFISYCRRSNRSGISVFCYGNRGGNTELRKVVFSYGNRRHRTYIIAHKHTFHGAVTLVYYIPNQHHSIPISISYRPPYILERTNTLTYISICGVLLAKKDGKSPGSTAKEWRHTYAVEFPSATNQMSRLKPPLLVSMFWSDRAIFVSVVS